MSFSLKRVSFRYEDTDKDALIEVSADLPDGGVIAVLGPSGCGKSTLLNMLALLSEGGHSGDVVYDDGQQKRNYSDLSRDPTLRAQLRREHFGSVLQNCYLLPHFSCLDNVSMPLALQGWRSKVRTEWAKMLIRKVDERVKVNAENGLEGVEGKMPRAVSLGQKQRMAVVRALVHNPRVVFADEPTSNLDRANTQAVLQMLLEWQRGTLHNDCPNEMRLWQESEMNRRTLILVCHRFESIEKEAKVALLFSEDHRLVGQPFTPDPTMANPWIKLYNELEKRKLIEPIGSTPS